VIQTELEDIAGQIRAIEVGYKESEWEHEVKLQQFNYLENERKQLFDEFHRLTYEMH
jgi:hypothetical protein